MQCCVQHLNTGVYQTVLLRASYGIHCQVIYERWEIDTEHAVRDPIDKDNAELFVDEKKILSKQGFILGYSTKRL